MSNETIKLFGWKRLKLLSWSTKLKKSGTMWFENLFKTGFNTEIKKVDKFYWGDLVIDQIGLSGILCVFGSPWIAF